MEYGHQQHTFDQIHGALQNMISSWGPTYDESADSILSMYAKDQRFSTFLSQSDWVLAI